jgi:hypothetical protein
MGVLARHQGLKIVGPGLLAMAVGLLVLYEILMRVEVVGQRRYACMRQPC